MNDTDNGLLAPVWEAIGELREVQLKHIVAPNALQLGPNITLHGTPEQRVAFFAALAKAQGAYEPIARSRTVEVRSEKGAYTFDYAPLEEVLSATQPALNANGLAWLCVPTEGALHTMLTHEGGAMLHSVEPLPAFDSPQKYGSALTYRRRYGYQCLTGTAPEYDDDGSAATGNQVQAMAQKRREPPAPAQRAPQQQVGRVERPAEPRPAPKPAAQPAPAAQRPPSVPPAQRPEPPTAATMEAMGAYAQEAAIPPAEVVEAHPATVVGSAPDPDEDDGRPASQDQANAIIQLAKALRWDRVKLDTYIADIYPTKTHRSLTFADAAALIPMLQGQVPRG